MVGGGQGARWQQGGCWGGQGGSRGGAGGGQGAAGGGTWRGALGGGRWEGGHLEGCDLQGEGMGGGNYIIYYRFISNDKLLFFNVI